MRLHYISPSVLPSRSANSVHVVQQCEGLIRAGAEVTLYAKRAMTDVAELLPALKRFYGVGLEKIRLVSYYSSSARAENVRIAALAVSDLLLKSKPEAIISRNLYASFVIGVMQRKPLLFETHQLEQGVRGLMQRAIMTCPWVTTVVISHKMLECLEEYHGSSPSRYLVLHDAAPDGITPLQPEERRRSLVEISPQAHMGWAAVCGYFGHLHAGRGIEIIKAMAAACPQVLFLVYGGNDREINSLRRSNYLVNLHFAGYVPYPIAQQAMRSVDVLLMPYQESVSIGIAGHDTARWMSPMKMFEYLASGVPVISSDLPPLREVLKDGENCLLVPASAPADWVASLGKLIADPSLARALGRRGHDDYRSEYTWTRRAQQLLAAATAL